MWPGLWGLRTESVDGLVLPKVFMDWVLFHTYFLKISQWRLWLWEVVNLRTAALSRYKGKHQRKEQLVPKCSADASVAAGQDSHPHRSTAPAVWPAAISPDRTGLDRIHALFVRAGITTLWARFTDITEMGILPTLTLGVTRDKHNVLDKLRCVSHQLEGSLCNCSGLELHGLPNVGNGKEVLEMLHGALGAVWMKVI